MHGTKLKIYNSRKNKKTNIFLKFSLSLLDLKIFLRFRGRFTCHQLIRESTTII